MKLLSLLLVCAVLAIGQTCQTTDIPSNGTFDGALTESDCTVRDYIRTETSNVKADALRVTLRERLVLRVRMTSTEIDSYSYLLNDRGAVIARNDNSGGGRNAEISVQLPAGTYTIVAATAATGLGAYQVTTSTRLPKTCTPQDLPLTGEAVEGDLTETDCAGVDLAANATDTMPVDVYKLDLAKASVLEITMSSSTVTPSLSLYDARGRRVGGINATSSMTARLRIGVPAGVFTLRAGTVRTATGVYRLSATREDRRVCEPVTLTPGETLSGEFARSDCRLVDLATYATWMGPVDQYKIELKERSIVKLRMESTLLDTYLMVIHLETGLLLGENDDVSSTSTDSEIYMSLPAGTFTIWALEFYGDSGRYTLKYEVEKPRSCTPASFEAPGTAATTLTRDGCRMMDLVAPSDSVAPAAHLTMKVSERVWTTVSATGTGLTPLVQLFHLDGLPIGIDGPVAEKAVLLLPGSYSVYVTTRTGGAGELTVNTTTRPPAPCEATPLPLGELKTGELTASDCREQELLPFLNSTARADLWKFEIETPGPFRAELGTEAAIPYMFLLDADLKPVAFDLNIPAMGPGARLSWTGRTGTFYLLVGTYSGPTPYTLRVGPDSAGTSQ